MPVSKSDIVSRGLKLCCPNCGRKTLFQHGALRINDRCPICRVDLNRGEGFFLGPMVLNYSFVAFGFVLPCIVLWGIGVLRLGWAIGIAAAGCALLPVFLYRLSWSLWLMLYFWFLPERLPANGGTIGREAED